MAPRLEAGTAAPPASLPRVGGGAISLTDFAAGSWLLYYFNPRADTPGCRAGPGVLGAARRVRGCRGVARTTFLIDAEGRIALTRVWRKIKVADMRKTCLLPRRACDRGVSPLPCHHQIALPVQRSEQFA
jgi:peroxiredoxin